MERKYVFTLAVAAIAGIGLGLMLRRHGPEVTQEPPVDLAPPSWDLAQGIDEAAAYLVKVDDDKGRFKYLVAGDGHAIQPKKYNVVRHAGAIYALADYQVQGSSADGKPKAADAAKRSAEYLETKYIRPIKDHADTFAVWSDPVEEGGHEKRFNAKLGGSGLGLIGLMGRYRAIGDAGANAANDLMTAQGLGRFIQFMQKPNGDFTSNYTDEKGPSSEFESLYYPGEAILGLTMLYEADHDPKWLETAAKGIAHLVEARKGMAKNKLPADHWLLIAMDRLYPAFGDLKSPPLTRDAMVDHALEIANVIVDGQDHVNRPAIAGCYTRDGRTTPTSTRLEGLLAVEHLLGAEPSHAQDRDRFRVSIGKGIAFLRRTQVTTGPNRGALPAAAPIPGEDGGVASEDGDENEPGDHRQEVRIDYVQHAMSAMMRYRVMCTADPAACPK